MGKRVTVRVPTRIDLAGGWTDVPAFCQRSTGHVVNVAINRYVTAEMNVDEQRRCTVSYSTDMPIGSGLGTSGAMNVGFLAAITGDKYRPSEIAELAFQFESLLGNKGGRQDQWASANGGIQHLIFQDDTVEVSQLNPSDSFQEWFEGNFVLFDSNVEHVSGDLHRDIWHRFENGDADIRAALERLSKAGSEMAEAIKKESQKEFARCLQLVMEGVDALGMHFHQPFRTTLQPLVETGDVLAWKAMGAGGGGVVGVLLKQNEDAKNRVKAALIRAGWNEIEWRIEPQGLRREFNLLD